MCFWHTCRSAYRRDRRAASLRHAEVRAGDFTASGTRRRRAPKNDAVRVVTSEILQLARIFFVLSYFFSHFRISSRLAWQAAF